MTEIVKAEPSEAGCWVEGSRGWTATSRVIDIAAEHGMNLTETDKEILAAWESDIANVIIGDNEVVDSHEYVAGQGGLLNETENWLNENVAPPGYSFGWHDGEFFLWSETDWCEVSDNVCECDVHVSTQLQRLVDAGVAAPKHTDGITYRGYPNEFDRYEGLAAGDVIQWADMEDPSDGYPPTVFYVGMMWGDYVGSDIDRSNYRSLLRDYPQFFVIVRDSMGAEGLALLPDFGRRDSSGHAEALADILIKLRDDYPLYDDEDHSNLEQELADEAWDAYLSQDVKSIIRGNYPHGEDILGLINDGALQREFYTIAYESNDGRSPYCESAVNVVFPEWEKTALEAVDAVLTEIIHRASRAAVTRGQLAMAIDIAYDESAVNVVSPPEPKCHHEWVAGDHPTGGMIIHDEDVPAILDGGKRVSCHKCEKDYMEACDD